MIIQEELNLLTAGFVTDRVQSAWYKGAGHTRTSFYVLCPMLPLKTLLGVSLWSQRSAKDTKRSRVALAVQSTAGVCLSGLNEQHCHGPYHELIGPCTDRLVLQLHTRMLPKAANNLCHSLYSKK